MKILIVNTLYSPTKVGGAELSVQQLAEHLVDLGHEVMVICLAQESKRYNLNGVSVMALKLKNSYWPFDSQPRSQIQKLNWHYSDAYNKKYDTDFLNIFQENRPDLIWTNNMSGFSTRIWDVAKKQNIKVVHTLRDYYLQCPKSTKYKHQQHCSTRCTSCKHLTKHKKKGSQQVDYVVGISQYILDDHKKYGYFNEVQSAVIYNGFQIEKKLKRNSANKLIFGFLGQIHSIKGIELLLSVLRDLDMSNWELNIAGTIDEVYRKKLEAIYASPQINYLGYTEPETFFMQTDLLIVPSLWNEPFGRVVVEAMLYQVPVLASNVGGMPELLEGNQAFLFEPNEQSLRDKLKWLLSDPSQLEQFVFDSSFLNSFSLKKSIQNYINIFEKVLKNRP